MIDLGLSKIALIGVVALVVIGPERLPKVARTIGSLLGRAQRYINDVKAEVGREVELDALHKMRTDVEDAARNVQETVHNEIHQQESALNDSFNNAWSDATSGVFDGQTPSWQAAHKVRTGRHSWRVKQGAMPQWYKRQNGIRGKAQSGAARVKRHRPAIMASKPKSFF